MKKTVITILVLVFILSFPIQKTFGQDRFVDKLIDYLKGSPRVSVRSPRASNRGGGSFFQLQRSELFISNNIEKPYFLRIFASCFINKKTRQAQEICWLGPGDSVFVSLPFTLQTDVQIPVSVLVYDRPPNFQTDGVVPQENSFVGSLTRVIYLNTRQHQTYPIPINTFQRAYSSSKRTVSSKNPQQTAVWGPSSYKEKFPGGFGGGGRHIVHIINNTVDCQITILDSISTKTVTLEPGQLYAVDFINYGTRSDGNNIIRVSFFTRQRQRQRTPSSPQYVYVFDKAREFRFTLNAYGIHASCFIATP